MFTIHYALIVFDLFLQINNDTSIPDYKSTCVVSSFGKTIAYKKLDEMDE